MGCLDLPSLQLGIQRAAAACAASGAEVPTRGVRLAPRTSIDKDPLPWRSQTTAPPLAAPPPSAHVLALLVAV